MMIGVSRGLGYIYAKRVHRVRLQEPDQEAYPDFHCKESYDQAGKMATALLLKRRPEVEEVSACTPTCMSGLASAILLGYCNNAMTLEMKIEGSRGWEELCNALGSGLCPRMDHVMIKGQFPKCWEPGSMPNRKLCSALMNRMVMGCFGIKVLEIDPSIDWESLLSSPACRDLEEVYLHTRGWNVSDRLINGLSSWLRTTTAPNLRIIHAAEPLRSTILANYTSPNVAPRLQSFSFPHMIGDPHFEPLLRAIERGSWPDLRELTIILTIDPSEDASHDVKQRVVNAITMCTPNLKKLMLVANSSIYPMLAQGLVEGGSHMPCLEELDLSGHKISEKGMKVLMSAFGDPVSSSFITSLKKLKLRNCKMDERHANILCSQMLSKGLCHHLEELNVSHNTYFRVADVVEVIKAGQLPKLRKLNLSHVRVRESVVLGLVQALKDQCRGFKWLCVHPDHPIPRSNLVSSMIQDLIRQTLKSRAITLIDKDTYTPSCHDF